VALFPQPFDQIRPITESDLPEFLAIRNDVRHHLHDSREFSIEECRSWFRVTNQVYLGIFNYNSMMGYFRLKRIDLITLEVGLDLCKNYFGKGVAFFAYQFFFDWLQSNSEILILQLRVLRHNQRAMRLYEKLGFVVVEELPDDYLMKKLLIPNKSEA
jgi:RimJ/RimL family protein N-acetyltransferase